MCVLRVPGTARGPSFPGLSDLTRLRRSYIERAGARAAPVSLSRARAHLLALSRSMMEEEGEALIGGRGSKDEGGGMLEPF